MPKVKISEYSATANSNTDVASINIDEGCAPSGINNAIRAIMGHLKDFQSGTSNDPFTVGSSGSLTLSYGTANGVAYLNGSKVLTTGSALAFDGTSLTFGSTSQRIIGDMSNATQASRLFAQTSTANTSTSFGVIPNGSSGVSQFAAYGASDPTNTQRMRVGVDSSSVYLISDITGTGSYLPLTFSTNGSERARIDTSGNLLVGSTSTRGSAKLDIRSDTSIALGSNASFYGTIGYSAGTGLMSLAAESGGGINFLSGSTERARIDSSGNLLVAKTSLSTTTVGVELRPGGRVVSTLASSTSGDSTYEVYSTGAGAYRFYVDMAGTVRATSTTITAISDERLKENVRDIDTGLNSIMALKPRRFDWKEGKGQDKKNVAGFIAQEFETIFPECVSTSKAGADGIEYKNINHETLIPTLVKAIQEQQALITTLTARITALEGA